MTKNIYQKLSKIFPMQNITNYEFDLINYSKDMYPKSLINIRENIKIQNLPSFIVYPENKEQIQQLLKLANEEKISIIPYGGGSGVCGGTLPLYNNTVIVDLKRMNKIINIDKYSNIVEAQAGIIGQHLEDRLNKEGFTLGHIPQSIYCSTLGGWLATRSAGQLSTKYGKIEDIVLSFEAVLPQGEIIETKSTPAQATGPNFMQLFLGSEGTLCIITKAKLKINKLPEIRLFHAFNFKNVKDGLEAIREIMQNDIKPSVVRLYDELDTLFAMHQKLEKKEYKPTNLLLHKLKSNIEGLVLTKSAFINKLVNIISKGCLLVLCFEGRKEIVKEEQKIVTKICEEVGAKDLGEELSKKWFNTRYDIAYNLSKIFDMDAIADTIEVATTYDRLYELYTTMRKIISKYALCMAHFSHAYKTGCSIYFTFATKSKNNKELYDRIWNEALTTCLNTGGVISHHHGIGILKGNYMQEELKNIMPIYKNIKKLLDPNNILNPYKMGL